MTWGDEIIDHHGGDTLFGVDLFGPKHCVTVGRKKRKRKAGAGSGVKIKSHTRSPRGSNKGKKRVRVDGYARGKPPSKRRRRKK